MPPQAAGSSISAATVSGALRRCSGTADSITNLSSWPGLSRGHDEQRTMDPPLMRRILFCIIWAAGLALPFMPAVAAEPREPYGIGLEGFAYPYPVHLLPLVNDGEQLRMAYMDVAPAQPNGRVAVLLHGRNFPASYWAPVIRTLNDSGYRVV